MVHVDAIMTFVSVAVWAAVVAMEVVQVWSLGGVVTYASRFLGSSSQRPDRSYADRFRESIHMYQLRGSLESPFASACAQS